MFIATSVISAVLPLKHSSARSPELFLSARVSLCQSVAQ